MPIDPAYLEQLQRRHTFAEWQVPKVSEPVQPPEGFSGRELPGWNLRRTGRPPATDGVTSIRGLWTPAKGGDEPMLDVEVWLCATPADARAWLLALLGDMQGPVGDRVPDGGPGEVAFRLGGGSAVLFARGQAVVRLRNAGRQVVNVGAEATAIDQWLRGAPEPR